ncbi:MAG: hypothetical protein J0H74_16625 [Chitinophagaceae bacterium]|nr:hypothetical protein [Chitinophagaceae bacterium]
MRKLLIAWLLLPLMGVGQTKNVLTVERYFPKIDKIAEFEKALMNHAQKYHTGDWKWRVLEIQSGPDAGGYQINEGPNSWDQIDKRGNLGAEHMNDWNRNVAPLLTDRYSSLFAEFQEELSTVQLTDYSDKVAVTHVFPKPGWGDKVEDQIKMIKKAWTAGNQSVAVYLAASSGPMQYMIATRYKQGLKEREKGFRKPFKERYEAENGAGSYESSYLSAIKEEIDHVWSEMLFIRADLGSQ